MLRATVHYKKINEDTKERKVADDSKQHSYDVYDKSDKSSSTVSTTIIVMPGVIDAREERTVTVPDIENEFLQSDNEENILMLLGGKLTKMMVKIDPLIYGKYITYSSKGVPVLYVQFSKTFYRMTRPALLSYKRMRSDLEGMNFEVNSCDPFFSNKMVNGT